MDQQEYLKTLAAIEDEKDRKKYIGPFWKECKERKNLEGFSVNFKANHLGTLSDSEMKRMAVERSHGVTHDFTSTILAESDAQKLVTYIEQNIIPWLLTQPLQFRNYLVSMQFQSATMRVVAQKQVGIPDRGAIKPVIGIDGQAIVVHYHGPEEYAHDDYWVSEATGGKTTWKKR